MTYHTVELDWPAIPPRPELPDNFDLMSLPARAYVVAYWLGCSLNEAAVLCRLAIAAYYIGNTVCAVMGTDPHPKYAAHYHGMAVRSVGFAITTLGLGEDDFINDSPGPEENDE